MAIIQANVPSNHLAQHKISCFVVLKSHNELRIWSKGNCNLKNDNSNRT